MIKKPTVLVCPLDWGIGHATRCVPVIREILKKDVEVILAASNRSLAFLKQEFPNLKVIDFPNYNISYPAKNSGMVIKILRQIPGFLKSIRQEHKMLQKLINEHHIDLVISDNRYGLYSNKVPSVFITHQLYIKAPVALKFIEPVLSRINFRYIKSFTECWIPDNQYEPNLSGSLSHTKSTRIKTFFIGPLSRFDNKEITNRTEFRYDILLMLSGPEPQRTHFEKEALAQLRQMKIKAAVILGKPEEKEKYNESDNIFIYSHLNSLDLKELIMDSRIILSRPGYSTIMDLSVLGKKAIFIPTPGQTEQEYLARIFRDKGIFYSMDQKKINISKALKDCQNYQGISLTNDYLTLNERISELLKVVNKVN
ncbi:MAG: hypothetical protein K9G76_01820 [Bacteroidales bacterium]|nr:hypothetical protein [Bacteroidales bacterium]MCF8403291.1 hypothetical protein [Bacteroidales bacterium]